MRWETYISKMHITVIAIIQTHKNILLRSQKSQSIKNYKNYNHIFGFPPLSKMTDCDTDV